jgi:hypothetical protein
VRWHPSQHQAIPIYLGRHHAWAVW